MRNELYKTLRLLKYMERDCDVQVCDVVCLWGRRQRETGGVRGYCRHVLACTEGRHVLEMEDMEGCVCTLQSSSSSERPDDEMMYVRGWGWGVTEACGVVWRSATRLHRVM